MKIRLLILALALMATGHAQNKNKGDLEISRNDTTYFERDMPVLDLDSCLSKFLTAIIHADRMASYFDEREIFYSVRLDDHPNYISMEVWPARWRKAGRFDYFGTADLDGMTVLFKGDARNRRLFSMDGTKQVRIKLQRPEKNIVADDFDNRMAELLYAPSMAGKYMECTGLTIFSQVYTEGKTTDFEMHREQKKDSAVQPASNGQRRPTDTTGLSKTFQRALSDLGQLLVAGKDFKSAVFVTENAFFNNTLPAAEYDRFIDGLVYMTRKWKEQNRLKDYRYRDSANMLNNLAIYKVLKDTIRAIGKNGELFYHPPYTYDFNDFFGRQNWQNMFVSKLLFTNTGNCHSLPYLYKILADEVGASCWLGLAPNHIYIKNRSQKSGWYNTELTSGSFPIDAWITASGYIPLQAIQNGIYMDTLSNQQAIALTVLDLAKGYEFHTKNYSDGFILKCCDLVLTYHPNNVQAILLKAETLKRNYQSISKYDKESAKVLYSDMERQYTRLFELGYREMPESMYIDWLKSLDTERAKYQNRNL